jgi:hypothetical protein
VTPAVSRFCDDGMLLESDLVALLGILNDDVRPRSPRSFPRSPALSSYARLDICAES